MVAEWHCRTADLCDIYYFESVLWANSFFKFTCLFPPWVAVWHQFYLHGWILSILTAAALQREPARTAREGAQETWGQAWHISQNWIVFKLTSTLQHFKTRVCMCNLHCIDLYCYSTGYCKRCKKTWITICFTHLYISWYISFCGTELLTVTSLRKAAWKN